jgi:hypothetical protein
LTPSSSFSSCFGIVASVFGTIIDDGVTGVFDTTADDGAGCATGVFGTAVDVVDVAGGVFGTDVDVVDVAGGVFGTDVDVVDVAGGVSARGKLLKALTVLLSIVCVGG